MDSAFPCIVTAVAERSLFMVRTPRHQRIQMMSTRLIAVRMDSDGRVTMIDDTWCLSYDVMVSLLLRLMALYNSVLLIYLLRPLSDDSPYLSDSQALLNTPNILSPSFSSRIRCTTKPLRSCQNSSLTTSFPLGPCAAGTVPPPSNLSPASPFSASLGTAAGGLATGVPPATAPPITITPNSTSAPASPPRTSATVLLSVTGFFLNRIFILEAGMEVEVA